MITELNIYVTLFLAFILLMFAVRLGISLYQ
jgi:photosystem I reaction center subunit XII